MSGAEGNSRRDIGADEDLKPEAPVRTSFLDSAFGSLKRAARTSASGDVGPATGSASNVDNSLPTAVVLPHVSFGQSTGESTEWEATLPADAASRDCDAADTQPKAIHPPDEESFTA